MTTPARSLFPALAQADWWGPFMARREASASNADLPVALAAAGHPDPATAMAHTILGNRSVLSTYASGRVPDGLRTLLRAELWRLGELLRRVNQPVDGVASNKHPIVLTGLAEPLLSTGEAERVAKLATALLTADADGVTSVYLEMLRAVGNGPAALYPVLTWRGGHLEPVRYPDTPAWEELVDLEGPLELLAQNTEALLLGKQANDVLAYGARGSGKSTAVRGLAQRYATAGLRLVEVPVGALEELPLLLEELRPQPLKFVLFVDDLSFGDGDREYRPLKSLLEGGVRRRPGNTVVYATSNRRHLVRERLSDRPDPLDDDVHAWDTHQERLALADRFGLVITFPAADQRQYLKVVRSLTSAMDISAAEDLDERALRFAEWNNGYSGRTAKQFVASLRFEPGQGSW